MDFCVLLGALSSGATKPQPYNLRERLFYTCIHIPAHTRSHTGWSIFIRIICYYPLSFCYYPLSLFLLLLPLLLLLFSLLLLLCCCCWCCVYWWVSFLVSILFIIKFYTLKIRKPENRPEKNVKRRMEFCSILLGFTKCEKYNYGLWINLFWEVEIFLHFKNIISDITYCTLISLSFSLSYFYSTTVSILLSRCTSLSLSLCILFPVFNCSISLSYPL